MKTHGREVIMQEKLKQLHRSIAISNVANGSTVSSYEQTNSKHSGKEQRVRKSIVPY